MYKHQKKETQNGLQRTWYHAHIVERRDMAEMHAHRCGERNALPMAHATTVTVNIMLRENAETRMAQKQTN